MSENQKWNGGFCFGGGEGGGDQTRDYFCGIWNRELIGVDCRKMNGIGGAMGHDHGESMLEELYPWGTVRLRDGASDGMDIYTTQLCITRVCKNALGLDT